MPKLLNRNPKYSRHRASGQAVVTIDGKDVYLGPYGTKASKAEYDRVIAQWLAGGRNLGAGGGAACDVYVAEVIAAFRTHAKTYYRRPDGSDTGKADNFDDAMRPLNRLYGHTLVIDFGPLALRALQGEMVRLGWCRTYINRQVNRVRHVFKWAASVEMIPHALHERLKTVPGLAEGRSAARESEPVKPVPEGRVLAVQPFVSRQVFAAAQVQFLAGMRAGEVLSMRPREIDRSQDPWVYTPAQHKTKHRGHRRVVDLGRRAQEVLAPFLEGRDPDAYVFSPAEAVAESRAARRAGRKTPLSCGNREGTNRARAPKKAPGDRYTVGSYWHAIDKACQRAFPPPAELARLRVKGRKGTRWETAAEWRQRLGPDRWAELQAWNHGHDWHSHQPRHSAGSKVRKHYGLEAARQVLGQPPPTFRIQQRPVRGGEGFAGGAAAAGLGR